jgi:hypothetical protein
MTQQIDGENPGAPNATQRQRRPWSSPRVILSELRSTYHQVGANPLDKNVFSTDHPTPSGSVGS